MAKKPRRPVRAAQTRKAKARAAAGKHPTQPLCWKLAPDEISHCDRAKDHGGGHSWDLVTARRDYEHMSHRLDVIAAKLETEPENILPALDAALANRLPSAKKG